MFRTALLSTILLAACACAPLAAQPWVQIKVIDRETGQWLPAHRHRGHTWIAGMPGHRYAVRLRNASPERVLVVLSVDGVNAVSGETAHPSQAGYVLAPWQDAEIAGWRKSYDDVAQFVFTDLPDSYAARTGRPDHVGVIGIAVFRERRWAAPVPPSPPIARGNAARSREARSGHAASEAHSGTYDALGRAPGRSHAEAEARAAAPAAADGALAGDFAQPQRLGTGHGAREWAPVARTQFMRASSRPAQVTQLRYDDRQALVALGVLPHWPSLWQRPQPQAFPDGFVADPVR